MDKQKIKSVPRLTTDKSSIYWGNTILSHWISEFEAVDGENERGKRDDDGS